MGFQVSPGVVVTEKDLTTIVPAVSTTDGAFAGVFSWGPLNDIVLIGDENQLVRKFGKPNNDTATSFFSAANFLAYGNKLRVVRVADTISTVDTSGLIADSTGTSVLIQGDDLLTATPRVRPGDVIDAGAEERVIVAVAASGSDTVLTIDEAFTADLSDALVTVRVSNGPLNATAEETTGSATPGIGVLIQNDAHYDNMFSGGLANVGPFAARFPGELGNSIRVSICPSAKAFSQVLAGSVSVSGTTLTGVGSNFTKALAVGSVVRSPTGEERTVVAIASDTSATINTAFKSSFSGATNVRAKWEYADAFGLEPGTSSFAADAGGANDELHVIVVDADGKISGSKGTILERFRFLSKASDAKTQDGASSYYVNVLNKTSEYIRWCDHLELGSNWGAKAAGTNFKPLAADAVNKPFTYRLAGGRDANVDLVGDAIDAARIKGYDLFKNAELVDVSLIVLGETPNTSVPLHVIDNICESRKDCVAFISPPKDAVVNNVGKEVEDTIAFRDALTSSSYAVMDSGWKYQYDKYNDTFRWIPLNADVAGLCARTDTNQDPWWSPAGYNRGVIKSAIKLAYNPFKAERDDLYVKGVNPVISTQGQGTLLFGDKTLLAKPSAFDRINVRRLFIVLEKAISAASKFTLFEFNDEFTRQQFRSLVEPFLRDVQARRGIYDFKVVCDRTNNTPEVIDRNEFVGDIYIKPARSINFIQLNFVAVRTGVDFTEIVGRA